MIPTPTDHIDHIGTPLTPRNTESDLLANALAHRSGRKNDLPPVQSWDLMDSACRMLPPFWVEATAKTLYTACYLAWDYTDTIIDICAQNRYPLKKACRALRGLRAEYNRFRETMRDTPVMESRALSRLEEANAQIMEDELGKAFGELTAKVERDLIRIDCPEGQRPLQLAAVMCQCVVEAVRRFSDDTNAKFTRAAGLPSNCRHMMLQTEFEQLFGLVPAFVHPKVMRETAPLREKTVGAILAEMWRLHRCARGWYEEHRKGGAA